MVFGFIHNINKNKRHVFMLTRMGRVNSNGFTIIEILVVMTIIVILSVVIFADYRLGQSQLTLQRASYKLAQDIRRMQVMAGLEEEACKKFLGEFHDNYKYGYGISLENTSISEYNLIADCDGDEKQSSDDEIIEVVYFEEGIKIKDLMVDGLNENKLSIVFTPPDPNVFIKNGISGDLAEIVISLKDDETRTKTVIINKIGLIDVD